MKDKRIIILTSIIIGVLAVVLGLSYSLFTFDRAGTNQELVLGDIWMKYTESNGMSLENALPGAAYSKYFEFTITGKNTYTEKDIWYDIRLIKGGVPEGKKEENRIEDKYLKFKLVEVNGEVETEIFTDNTYNDLTNQIVYIATIPKATNEYSKTYRLYMVISENLTIGNVEGSISSEEFETLFGSIKVATTGDFTEKEVPITVENSEDFKKLTVSKNTDTCKTYVEEDGITYISGTKDCIDFNYVWYSGKLWRITSIHPDGTMKMVTEDIITTIYYASGAYTSVNYVNQWLNQEFLPTLYNYENMVVEDAKWYETYSYGYGNPYKPSGSGYNLGLVGILNSYDYYMSYKNTNYSSGYLNNSQPWWLNGISYMEYDWQQLRYQANVDSDGEMCFEDLDNSYGVNYSLGVRPSIYLKSNVETAGGTGTIEDPYTLKGDNEAVVSNITLLNTRQSGEYVKLEGDSASQVFRIVNVESTNTKIVLDDYVRDTTDIDQDGDTEEVLTKYLTSSTVSSGYWWNNVSSTDTTYWKGYLHTVWLSTINKNLLEKAYYYFGTYTDEGSYKTTVCSTVSSTVSINECIENDTYETRSQDYLGLLRLGEIFASQFRSDSSTSDMWLITPYYWEGSTNLFYISYVGSYGRIEFQTPSNNGPKAVQPTLNLKSTLVIKSGSGTKQDPFLVGLSS